MTTDTLSDLSRLPNEIIAQIVNYVQPFSCQVKLMPIPVFRPFIERNLCHQKKWRVSTSSLCPVVPNKALEHKESDDLMPVGYVPPTPVCPNFKNIQVSGDIDDEDEFRVFNVGSLIHTVTSFHGIYPKSIYFETYGAFKTCSYICPDIIAYAQDVRVRVATLLKGNLHSVDRCWAQVDELINLDCGNVTELNLQYVDLAGLDLHRLLLLTTLKSLGMVTYAFMLQNLNLTTLELTDTVVDCGDLKYLPESLLSLEIDRVIIHSLRYELPFTQLREFLSSFDLYDENTVIDLQPLTCLEKCTIFGCIQFHSLDQLKLPASVQHLTIESCFYLSEIGPIKEYTNLKSFTWTEALLSLDFYLHTTFPETLTHLTVNGQNSKSDVVIDGYYRWLPQRFECVYGMKCYIVDHDFKLPTNLTDLLISNCRYLSVNCARLELPPRLENLTLLNLANLRNIHALSLPDSLRSLNLNSNKIKCLHGLKIPENLRILKLDDNRLAHIPDSLLMNKLTTISLTDNLIRSPPDSPNKRPRDARGEDTL
ncbi:hypothetical protein Cantr_00543 [Candida viswanathii]|uniref:Uncharacterized protein n=1 Tax=Candida viswanathii TaxID=5486 RepID=A0A367YH06_9ASCO|nr:hypothetical protein Cantr_00543 [Candida viswanathii]